MVTADERKSKVCVALAVPNKKANTVRQAIIGMLQPLRKFVKTITYDNGKEFALHEKIANSLRCDSYFTTVYHSCQSQNNNANGLLRQYFPKPIELNNITEKEIIIAIDKLNNRPRKCLGYKAPYETFKELTGIDSRKALGYVFIT